MPYLQSMQKVKHARILLSSFSVAGSSLQSKWIISVRVPERWVRGVPMRAFPGETCLRQLCQATRTLWKSTILTKVRRIAAVKSLN